MKANEFRAIALSMAEASESAHMGHPDFRVGGKIFASLGYPDDSFGAVMLASEEQEKLLRAHPGIFTPANGAWGATRQHMRSARRSPRAHASKGHGRRLADASTEAPHRAASLITD